MIGISVEFLMAIDRLLRQSAVLINSVFCFIRPDFLQKERAPQMMAVRLSARGLCSGAYYEHAAISGKYRYVSFDWFLIIYLVKLLVFLCHKEIIRLPRDLYQLFQVILKGGVFSLGIPDQGAICPENLMIYLNNQAAIKSLSYVILTSVVIAKYH